MVEQGGAKAISMVVQIFLARLLVPEDFGLLAILLVVVNISDALAQSGFGLALIQRKNASEDLYSTAFWISIALSIVIYAIIFFIAPIVSSFYNKPELSTSLRVISIVVVFNAASSIQRAYLQKRFRFKTLSIISVASTSVSGAVGIVCALWGLGLWSLIIQTLLQGMITLLLMFINIDWKPSFVFLSRDAFSLFNYGWKMCATSILNSVSNGLSELVIGKTCGAIPLGYYSQGRKYPNAITGSLTNAVSNVMFPSFSCLQDRMDVLRDSARKSLMLGSFCIVPLTFFMAAAADQLINILLTSKWQECVFVFQVTSLSYSVLFLQIVNLRVYMALGRSDVYLSIHIIKSIANAICVVAIAVITENIECVAAAAAAISLVTVLCVDIVPANKLYGYSAVKQLKDIALIYLSGFVAAFASYGVSAFSIEPLALLVLQFIIFSIVYCLAIHLLDKSLLKGFFELIKG